MTEWSWGPAALVELFDGGRGGTDLSGLYLTHYTWTAEWHFRLVKALLYTSGSRCSPMRWFQSLEGYETKPSGYIVFGQNFTGGEGKRSRASPGGKV